MKLFPIYKTPDVGIVTVKLTDLVRLSSVAIFSLFFRNYEYRYLCMANHLICNAAQ